MSGTYLMPLVISPLILVYSLTEPLVRCRALFLLYVEVGELSAYKDIGERSINTPLGHTLRPN